MKHPFPPVVRWAILPGLLAFAGGLAGAAAGAVARHDGLVPLLAMGATSGAICAFTLALSIRPPIAAAVAPLLLVAVLVGILSALGRGSPGRLLADLFRDPKEPLVLVALVWSQVIPSLAYLRRPPGGWGFPAGLFLAGGIVWAVLFFSLQNAEREQLSISLFGILVAVSPLPALAATRVIADRLRPPPEC